MTASTVVLSACADTSPYVYRADMFNRESATFAKGPEDISEAVVCYTRRKTTPKIIRDLAIAECAKYKKVAVYSHQDLGLCPLMTPSAAHFRCELP